MGVRVVEYGLGVAAGLLAGLSGIAHARNDVTASRPAPPPLAEPETARLDGPRNGHEGDWLDPLAPVYGTGTLVLLEARCLDNGEGDECPHGPFGSIYVNFFPADEPHWPAGVHAGGEGARCLRRPDDPSQCRRRLRGPHVGGTPPCPFTKPPHDEWVDGDRVRYAWRGSGDLGPGIYAWPEAQQAVVMRLWESDPGGRFGRRDDVLGLERIDRAATEAPGGVWVEFHRYTSDDPRQPTPDLSFRVRLATVPAKRR